MVASLGTASVEVWLLRMLNYAVKIGVPVDWTFYCTEGRGGMDGRARALGAKVVYSPVTIGTKLNFVRRCGRICGKNATMCCTRTTILFRLCI